MWMYGVFLWCVYKYTGVHAFVNPYIEPLLEKYILPTIMPLIEQHIIKNYMLIRDHPAAKPYLCYLARLTEKYQNFYHLCQPTIDAVRDTLELYMSMCYQYFYIGGNILYTMAKIHFIEWLDVCGIEDSKTPGVYWVKYTSMGQIYRIPVKMARARGPSKRDEELDTVFGLAVSGPHGDYHGQQELLRSMVVAHQILATNCSPFTPVVERPNVSLDEVMRTPDGEHTGSVFSSINENRN
jgi:hypothetical protein